LIIRAFLKDADFLANFQAKPGVWRLRVTGGSGKAGAVPGGLLDMGWAKDVRTPLRTMRQDLIVRGKAPDWVPLEQLQVEVEYSATAEADAEAALAEYVRRNRQPPPFQREQKPEAKRP